MQSKSLSPRITSFKWFFLVIQQRPNTVGSSQPAAAISGKPVRVLVIKRLSWHCELHNHSRTTGLLLLKLLLETGIEKRMLT